MAIEESARFYLLEQSAVSALIGTRCYPMRLPQGTAKPAVTYQRIGGGEDVTHSGAGPARALMQFDCWADDYRGALALAHAVRVAFSGFRGPMGTARWVTGRIVNVIDLPETDPVLWRRTLDVRLDYEEAA